MSFAGARRRRAVGVIGMLVLPVIGFFGAYGAWVFAHLLGERVCGMAFGVHERIGVNVLGLVWTVLAVGLTAAAGVILAYCRGPIWRTIAGVLLLLLVLGSILLPLYATGTCDGIPSGGRYPPGR